MAIQNGFIQIIQDEKRDYQYEEAMKTLRTNIQFSGNGLKVIMLTSAMPDEGKSETSFQLAISMAQTEGRVLFIDADIRKSVLVSRFGGGQQIYGLTQYLTGQRPLGEVLYHTNLPNLDIIFSGPMAPNPAELLSEDAFSKLIAWARNEYDTIIIDTPPLGSVIDGAIIAQRCDGAILLVESGALSYRLVQKAKRQLERTGCRILGAVLNRVDMAGSGYYHRCYVSSGCVLINKNEPRKFNVSGVLLCVFFKKVFVGLSRFLIVIYNIYNIYGCCASGKK